MLHVTSLNETLEGSESPRETIAARPSQMNKKRCLDSSTLLPIDFCPNNYTVICGRGKACANAIGNRRLKVLASLFITKYSNARNKEEKTLIVSKIMEMIEDACPDERGTFVKHSNGRWYVVDDSLAREKIGSALRELLFPKYKSSSKSKQIARKRRKSLECIPTVSTSCGSMWSDTKIDELTEKKENQVNPTKTIEDDRGITEGNLSLVSALFL